MRGGGKGREGVGGESSGESKGGESVLHTLT